MRTKVQTMCSSYSFCCDKAQEQKVHGEEGFTSSSTSKSTSLRSFRAGTPAGKEPGTELKQRPWRMATTCRLLSYSPRTTSLGWHHPQRAGPSLNSRQHKECTRGLSISQCSEGIFSSEIPSYKMTLAYAKVP